jgi:hypothetical protein
MTITSERFAQRGGGAQQGAQRGEQPGKQASSLRPDLYRYLSRTCNPGAGDAAFDRAL